MIYTNGTINKSYRELCVHFNASLPRNNPENWPDGPWEKVELQPSEPTSEMLINNLKTQRDETLMMLTHTFPDGREIQCRPSDEFLMRNAIERMTRLNIEFTDWFMNDDNKSLVTVNDLQEAIISGQDQAAIVWNDFFTKVENLKNL